MARKRNSIYFRNQNLVLGAKSTTPLSLGIIFGNIHLFFWPNKIPSNFIWMAAREMRNVMVLFTSISYTFKHFQITRSVKLSVT